MIDINTLIKHHNAYALHNKNVIVSLVYDCDPAVLVVIKIKKKKYGVAQLIQKDTQIDDVEYFIGEPEYKVLSEGTPKDMKKEMQRLRRTLCATDYSKYNTTSLTRMIISMVSMDRDREVNRERQEKIKDIFMEKYYPDNKLSPLPSRDGVPNKPQFIYESYGNNRNVMLEAITALSIGASIGLVLVIIFYMFIWRHLT